MSFQTNLFITVSNNGDTKKLYCKIGPLKNWGFWKTKLSSFRLYLNIGESDTGVDEMEKGDLNFDREARRQLHVDEILQFLNTPKTFKFSLAS